MTHMADFDSTDMEGIASVVESLIQSPSATIGHATELRPLLLATNARAVGCWRHDEGMLRLAGFLALDDMPLTVQTDFVAAIRDVPLTASQFGVVQAVIRNGPAVNHQSESVDAPVTGSIGWLGRLEAASSLAVPLLHEHDLIGALAVAAASRIEPNDAVWRFLVGVARQMESG